LRLITDAAAAGSPFELMLLDWKMPEMDGLELARRCDALAKQGVLPYAPRIILVTAHGRNQLGMAIADTRIDAILEKPILPSQLFDAIVNLRPGQGASVTRATRREPHWSSLTVAIRGARILLVEDNKTNQLVACEFLHAMGMEVELADDGMQAVEKVRQGEFDLVLMDLQMPLMDGFEAARAIRKTERGRDLPIVAMTAAAMDKDKQATEAAGMNDHISKPIDPELLAKSLLAWLPQRKPLASGTKHHQDDGDDSPFELPGLDLAAALKSLGNSWSLVRKVCVGFVQHFSDASEQLERFLQCDDFTEAIRLVHTIKGLALNVGALDLERVARQFERDLNGRETSHRAEFEHALARTLAALAALHGGSIGEPAVDAARPLSQLRKLETMLQKKQGTARHLAKDIEAMLANTALQTSFKVILSKAERLQFDDALRLLRDLLDQHFADAL
jgi:two-component system sensor histidine kinase/response regulator